MNIRRISFSTITALLVIGSTFSEASVAGSFRKSIFRSNHHHSFSCRSKSSHRIYSVTIANRKIDQQIYWIDGVQFQLFPGQQHTFSKIIGRSDRCRKGNFGLPIIEFNRFGDNSRFNSKKIRLDERSSFYYFDRGLNVVSLEKG